jgi:hypothetical protein
MTTEPKYIKQKDGTLAPILSYTGREENISQNTKCFLEVLQLVARPEQEQHLEKYARIQAEITRRNEDICYRQGFDE